MTLDILLYLLAGLLMLGGLLGVVFPVLPGVPLVFAGMLLAAWTDHFRHVGWVTLIILAVLTALSVAADFFATALGAKKVGASRKALLGSVIGTVVGFFIVPPWGIFIGPFVGALLGELWHSQEVHKSLKVGLGTWLGLVLGVVLKLGLAFAMLALFVFVWIWNR